MARALYSCYLERESQGSRTQQQTHLSQRQDTVILGKQDGFVFIKVGKGEGVSGEEATNYIFFKKKK